jgi:hypothetical protein
MGLGLAAWNVGFCITVEFELCEKKEGEVMTWTAYWDWFWMDLIIRTYVFVALAVIMLTWLAIKWWRSKK